MVELSLIKPGERFSKALVRIQSAPESRVPGCTILTVRQEAPVEFQCAVKEPDTTKRFVKFSTWARRHLTKGDLVWVSGTRTAEEELQVTKVTYDTSLQRTRATIPHPARKRLARAPDSLAKRRVLEEAMLLEHILGYVIPEDIAKSVIYVGSPWSTIGLSILQSYKYFLQVNMEVILYDIFQSAQLYKNMRTWQRFKDQRDFSELLLAGAKMCDICLRHGKRKVLWDTFVEIKLVKTLQLAEPRNASSSHPIQEVYTAPQLQFIKAALLQLSQLNLETHEYIIRNIGTVMRNCPRLFFDTSWTVADWTLPLRTSDIFCPQLQKSIEDLYGVDWCWDRLPNETSKEPIREREWSLLDSTWHTGLRDQKWKIPKESLATPWYLTKKLASHRKKKEEDGPDFETLKTTLYEENEIPSWVRKHWRLSARLDK